MRRNDEANMEERSLSELKFKTFPIIPELTDEEKNQLKSSMDDFGTLYPILINRKSEILDGNHRARLWQQLGGKKIPVNHVKNHPELDSNELSQEAFQIRMCLSGRNLRDQEKIDGLTLRLSELNKKIILESSRGIVPLEETDSPQEQEIEKHGDTTRTANQLGIDRATVRRRKKRAREGTVKKKPLKDQWTIDDVTLEIEKHIGKALSYLQSDKYKEHWHSISEERQKTFLNILGMFLNHIRLLMPEIKTKLIDGG